MLDLFDLLFFLETFQEELKNKKSIFPMFFCNTFMELKEIKP